jgi:hypothetical protein
MVIQILLNIKYTTMFSKLLFEYFEFAFFYVNPDLIIV